MVEEGERELVGGEVYWLTDGLHLKFWIIDRMWRRIYKHPQSAATADWVKG